MSQDPKQTDKLGDTVVVQLRGWGLLTRRVTKRIQIKQNQ